MNVRRLKLKANKGLDYLPGQFANLSFWKDAALALIRWPKVTEDDTLEFQHSPCSRMGGLRQT